MTITTILTVKGTNVTGAVDRTTIYDCRKRGGIIQLALNSAAYLSHKSIPDLI